GTLTHYVLRITHHHRNALTAADAEGGEAEMGIAALHLVQEGDEDTGAAGADRVAEGDGAAVDVDLLGVEAKLTHHGHALRRERLVRLHQIKLAHIDISAG